MLRDYNDFIFALRDKGFNYRQISEALEEEYGYKVSRQAVTKYINNKKIHKLDIRDMIAAEDLEVVLNSTNAKKAHEYLLSKGYDIKYHRVLSFRNQSKGCD